VDAASAPVHPLTRDEEEQVVCVDRYDRTQGAASKLEVHRQGLLHRAFSILVFNERQELLLQRRAHCKYHFAGRWSNTCCGHPRPGEGTEAAAIRRLREELGFAVPLQEHQQLVYRARDPASRLIEHEYLHVFHGTFTGEPVATPDEVGAWRWTSIPEVREDLAGSPDSFTPWFVLLMDRLFEGEETDVIRGVG
jgi:isopentenyl-diphosphate delta-isomerase